jgi:uridine kinase
MNDAAISAADVCRLIRPFVENLLDRPNRSLIGIYGQGGLGKTALASCLADHFHEVEFTSVDGYLVDRQLRPRNVEGDLYADYTLLQNDLDCFLSGQQIRLRRYDHDNGAAVQLETTTTSTTRCAIVEGGIFPAFIRKGIMSLGVLVIADPRRYRKLRRDVDLMRGYDTATAGMRLASYSTAWKEYGENLYNEAQIRLRWIGGSYELSLATHS